MRVSCLTIIVMGVNCAFASIPLFRHYPELEQNISHTALGDFPTPVEQCIRLSNHLGCTLLCKRDDQAGAVRDGSRLFGGNKVRKLEFLLARALAIKATTVLTFGCAGSNHALATTVYARQLGLATRCLLAPQPNSWVVKRNLLLQMHYGAELYTFTNAQERITATEHHTRDVQLKTGSEPYTIPVGGSTPLGVLGFINAVFELEEQMKAAQENLPDFIYVPAGSMGTLVGLLIGLQLIKASTVVVAVAIGSGDVVSAARSLFERTRDFLTPYQASFLDLAWSKVNLIVADSFYGNGYGHGTQEGQDATTLFFDNEAIVLDDTYTAKAAAALIHDAHEGKIRTKKVLFWLTFFGDACKNMCDHVSYNDLPQPFHTYFE